MDYLEKRAEELMLNRMPRNEDIMNEVFEFNVRNLEATASLTISQYIIGLSQFIIYFSSEVNKTRVELMQKKNLLDLQIDRSEVKGKNKADRRRKIIDNAPELQQVEMGIELLEQELALVENREKYLMELINSFKKELSRRDLEERLIKNDRRY